MTSMREPVVDLWMMDLRFTDNNSGCVSLIGRLPETGSILTINSASVVIKEKTKTGDQNTLKKFCGRDLEVIAIKYNHVKSAKQATIFVKIPDNTNNETHSE
jgi:hypothetical protein